MCKAIEDMKNTARNEGIILGKAEGKAEGLLQGKAEGKAEGLIVSAVDTAMDLGKNVQEAIEYASIKFNKTPEEIKRYLNKEYVQSN